MKKNLKQKYEFYDCIKFRIKQKDKFLNEELYSEYNNKLHFIKTVAFKKKTLKHIFIISLYWETQPWL